MSNTSNSLNASTPFTLVAFGEIVWDDFMGERFIGGAPFNVAAHLAQMGEATALISAVGQDTLGDETLATAGEYGVSLQFFQRNEHPTSVTKVDMRDGSPHYTLAENAACDFIEKVQDKIHTRGFYFGTYAQKSPQNARTLYEILKNNRFESVFCDLNLRPNYTAEAIDTCLRYANVLKINRDEIKVLHELGFSAHVEANAAAIYLAETYKNLTHILITLDEDGAILYDVAERVFYHQEAIPCQIVSTVGAGDSFFAAYIHKTIHGETPQTALQYAAKHAAFTISHREAVPTLTRVGPQ